MDDLETQKIPGDTISPKLFTMALEDIFKQLNWDQKGINIDGMYLNHLRFADDVVLISTNLEELQEMITELKEASEKSRLSMNLNKTKILSPDEVQMHVGDSVIERVEQCRSPNKTWQGKPASGSK